MPRSLPQILESIRIGCEAIVAIGPERAGGRRRRAWFSHYRVAFAPRRRTLSFNCNGAPRWQGREHEGVKAHVVKAAEPLVRFYSDDSGESLCADRSGRVC
jgi:hypothetical protein